MDSSKGCVVKSNAAAANGFKIEGREKMGNCYNKGKKMVHLIVSENKKQKQPEIDITSCSSIDQDTLRGHFGWALVGNEYLPFIFRSKKKFCAVRIVETKILKRFSHLVHHEIYSCVSIESYYLTKEESDLLNEINLKHCDSEYGVVLFTTRDLIVALDDVREFHTFLETCCKKLVNCFSSNNIVRCGFMRINKESLVPYVIYNRKKYVPLFYFEGEIDSLKQKAIRIEGWDLSYLKFCCKLQGVRNELFSHDSCLVVTLDDVQRFFLPGTLFEDCWPKESFNSNLFEKTISDAASERLLATPHSILTGTICMDQPNNRMYVWSNWNATKNTTT